MREPCDLNRDSYDDMGISIWLAATDDQEIHIIFGNPSGFSNNEIDLTKLTGSNGFILRYKNPSTELPGHQTMVACLKDVNGDGIDDLGVGVSA
jgi:hypothetical protein